MRGVNHPLRPLLRDPPSAGMSIRTDVYSRALILVAI
jgi:hypothetical protein